METRLTVTCMIAMKYNEAVMHIVLFHWNRLGSFLIFLLLSSSKIEKFSVCDSRYNGKFSSILLLVNLQLCPYHCGRGRREIFVKLSFQNLFFIKN